MFADEAALVSTDESQLRSDALRIARVGLESLDPAKALSRLIQASDGQLKVAESIGTPLDGPIHILGAGKASVGVAEHLVAMLGDRVVGGLVAANGDGRQLGSVSVVPSTHPLPSADSERVGRAMLEYADGVGDDLVIATFTGGSSAMVAAPPGDVTLDDKIALTELLLASGLDVVEMNTVRKHVSDIKGGRLAARMPRARILNLTVSDVARNVIDAITDPSTQDGTTPDDAVAILQGSGLWTQVPDSVRRHLATEAARSPDLASQSIETVLVSSGLDACRVMASEAETLGYEPVILSTGWAGEAAGNGAFLASIGIGALHSGTPVGAPCAIIGCGGESTVKLPRWVDAARDGGPNQELALAAALSMRGESGVVVLSLDTDGSDGGTGYAGAIVDGGSIERSGLGLVDAIRFLHTHGSTTALAKSGDLLTTGHTGTNVNDLFVVLVGS